MPLPRDYRNTEVYISEGNICDLLASFLYQTQVVGDYDEVLSVSLGERRPDGMYAISFMHIPRKEAILVVHK